MKKNTWRLMNHDFFCFHYLPLTFSPTTDSKSAEVALNSTLRMLGPGKSGFFGIFEEDELVDLISLKERYPLRNSHNSHWEKKNHLQTCLVREICELPGGYV